MNIISSSSICTASIKTKISCSKLKSSIKYIFHLPTYLFIYILLLLYLFIYLFVCLFTIYFCFSNLSICMSHCLMMCPWWWIRETSFDGADHSCQCAGFYGIYKIRVMRHKNLCITNNCNRKNRLSRNLPNTTMINTISTICGILLHHPHKVHSNCLLCL